MFDSLRVLNRRARCVRLCWGLLACFVLVGLDLALRSAAVPFAQAVWPAPPKVISAKQLVLIGKGHIPMPVDTPSAHASSLLAMPLSHPSSVMAFWFAGARESGPDVQIAAAQFDRLTQQWSPARFVLNRFAIAEQLGFGVRRLGNPVSWLDRQGKIHLFVVATGLGGWAASRIVHLRQNNEGQAFSELSFDVVRVLPLSWLWNTSFLVRAAPLPLADGGMVLPVHFELGIKYPVALRFDAKGAFKGMVRISSRTHLLQPTFLMLSESKWLALLRDQSEVGKVAVAQTLDHGRSWVDLPDLELHNPNSSIAGLALAPGHLYLAHNSLPHGRTVLDLSRSVAGRDWALVDALEHGAGQDEYSYPALTWADDSLWVSYTDQRERISWQRFSFSPSKR